MPTRVAPDIPRPRLLARLGRTPVTLVCGPPGSGKTTLLAAWAASAGVPVAWLSLEPGDDTPERLWPAMLESLKVAGVAAGMPAADELDHYAARLLNALAAAPAAVTLVIDEAHRVTSRAGRDALSFLLAHLPAGHRVLLGARWEPALRLHALRVRTALSEVRAGDLAFSPDESAAVLAAHELDLTPGVLEPLHAGTEGWAAGVRLSALGRRRTDDPGLLVRDWIDDFLIAEVLEPLPADERAFLMRTAMVPKLDGALANAVAGRSDGQRRLERLVRRNGFVIGLDDRDRWFRYHPALRGCLRRRLHALHPEQPGECLRRAAAWRREHGLASETLELAEAPLGR